MPTNLKITGLSTYHNELDQPCGTLLTADNIVIDRKNVATSRRGFADYGGTYPCDCDRGKQLIMYKDRIIRHFDTTLQYECCCRTGCTWTSFSGSYTETEPCLRIKYTESNGNLYFTTNDGIKKISGTINDCCQTNFACISITNAGAPKALDLTGSVKYTCTGFLCTNSQTAYRILWGIRDCNCNVILGSPSGRLLIKNPTCQKGDVNLSFSVPDDVTNICYFYQIYRTGITTTSPCCVDPGEEMNLIYEANITQAQICAGIVNETDCNPDCFRESGLILYTNPTTGEGILQANEKPPLAKDIALFAGHTFYANTQGLHRKKITMLSACCFVSGTSKFIVGNSTGFREYTFVGEAEVTDYVFNKAQACFCSGCCPVIINHYSASDERRYAYWFKAAACQCAPIICCAIITEVNIVCDTTAADIASSFNSVINCCSNCDFTSVLCCVTVTVTNFKNGNVTDATSTNLCCACPEITICITTQGDGECACCQEVLLSSLASPAQAIDETARSLVSIINRDNCGIVNAYYQSGQDDLPGIILLEAENLSDTTFYIGVDGGIGTKFNPEIPEALTGDACTYCVCCDTITISCHGFVAGNSIFIYGTDTCPVLLGRYYVKTVGACCCFTISTTKDGCTVDIVTDSSCCHGTFFLATELSQNEKHPNRLYWSKFQKPEAVPALNFIDIGGKDDPIRRILPLRDNMFALKDDGAYIVTGQTSPFGFRLIDSSAQIIATDSAAVVNNKIYALTKQGIATISDTGAGIVSYSIEDKTNAFTKDNFNQGKTFGVGYEKDRSYLLFAQTCSNDTSATQVYRYYTFNGSWTRWTLNATSAAVNPKDDKLYLNAGNINYVQKERKNLDRTDFADREFDLCVLTDTVCGTLIELSATSCVEKGDVIVQTQGVTVQKFNRLLQKLDDDQGLSCNNYVTGNCDVCWCGEISGGVDIGLQLTSLITKVCNDDCCTCYTAPTTCTFCTIKTSYNTFICELNSSTGTSFSNYKAISCCTCFEALILNVCSTFNKITTSHTMNYISGPITIYKGYERIIEWSSQDFNEASTLKQYSEATVLFDGNNFYSACLEFSSDLSKDFEGQEFFSKGNGFFGSPNFGTNTFGGLGNDVPYRKLVPRRKQKCRYLSMKFSHQNAREDFKITGASMSVREISERAYRKM